MTAAWKIGVALILLLAFLYWIYPSPSSFTNVYSQAVFAKEYARSTDTLNKSSSTKPKFPEGMWGDKWRRDSARGTTDDDVL